MREEQSKRFERFNRIKEIKPLFKKECHKCKSLVWREKMWEVYIRTEGVTSYTSRDDGAAACYIKRFFCKKCLPCREGMEDYKYVLENKRKSLFVKSLGKEETANV